MGDLGRVLMIAGGRAAGAGGPAAWRRIPGLGRLPGDIVIEREHFRFFCSGKSKRKCSLDDDVAGRWADPGHRPPRDPRQRHAQIDGTQAEFHALTLASARWRCHRLRACSTPAAALYANRRRLRTQRPGRLKQHRDPISAVTCVSHVVFSAGPVGSSPPHPPSKRNRRRTLVSPCQPWFLSHCSGAVPSRPGSRRVERVDEGPTRQPHFTRVVSVAAAIRAALRAKGDTWHVGQRYNIQGGAGDTRITATN